MSKFASKVAAKIKGDDALAIGTKIESKVKSLLASQISLLNSKKVDLKLALDDASERLDDVLYPVKTPVDGESYLYQLKSAKGTVEALEDQIEEVDESIEFYNELLDTKFGPEKE